MLGLLDQVGSALDELAADMRLVGEAVRTLGQILDLGGELGIEAVAMAAAAAAAEKPLRRGPFGYPDDHYRRIALAYLRLQREAPGILRKLAEEEDRLPETIRD